MDENKPILSEEVQVVTGDIPEFVPESDAGKRSMFSDFDFLLAKSEGRLEEYEDHILNFDGSKEMCRVIRGSTAMFGELNYALADICIGIFGLGKRYKFWGVSE